MFQHVFAEMNHMLGEIMKHYPTAQETQKHQLMQKWNMLKTMSDGIIDEWLSFEEKMGQFRQHVEVPSTMFSNETSPEMELDAFVRGQGYFRLMMFHQAVQQFSQVIRQYPDSLLARMYLAMAHLHLEETDAAQNHFQMILPLTNSQKLKAMIYNALGCIAVKHGNVEKAQEFFTLALQCDPTLPDPLINLKVCQQNRGQLQYGSQLISLM
ncbi:tetratricopeptide repeat protein [Paenibacillus sp.]|jgi:Tfp pilus assembly protein PilF|uniref:tetratricopeptide repeat protein n=1 Tax=Paenibacillus sp. TaxID=58172 RepID=UPI00282D1DDB|nr:tetratricopeptide repeat protein [Paenibacillus sp.]MDR0266730.1 tetratricopeptide repeat protein [Paenibacillus sp.]